MRCVVVLGEFVWYCDVGAGFVGCLIRLRVLGCFLLCILVIGDVRIRCSVYAYTCPGVFEFVDVQMCV